MKTSISYGPSAQGTCISFSDGDKIHAGITLAYRQLQLDDLLGHVEVVRAFPGYRGEILAHSLPHIQVIVREEPLAGKEHTDAREKHEQEIALPANFTQDDVFRIVMIEMRTQLQQIIRAHEKRATKLNEVSRKLASARKPK